MILEERDYRLVPGATAAFLKAYETLGLPVQRRHLGEPVGFFTTDIGELNHVLSMWRYADYADRSARRAQMLADPEGPPISTRSRACSTCRPYASWRRRPSRRSPDAPGRTGDGPAPGRLTTWTSTRQAGPPQGLASVGPCQRG